MSFLNNWSDIVHIKIKVKSRQRFISTWYDSHVCLCLDQNKEKKLVVLVIVIGEGREGPTLTKKIIWQNMFSSQAGLRTQQPIKWCVLLFPCVGKTVSPIRCRISFFWHGSISLVKETSSFCKCWSEKRFVDHVTSVEDYLEGCKNKNLKEKTKQDGNVCQKRKEQWARIAKHRTCRIKQAPCRLYLYCET